MLRFEKKLNVTPDNLEDLSEIQRAQLFDAYPKWFGKEPPSIEAMFLEADDKEGIALCEFYQVYESDDATEPKYDVWIVNVDTGSVYESGTTLDTGIGMIQNYFQQIESDDKELAHELHAAFVRYIQQMRRQKPADALEEDEDERAIADTLAQEIVNGRSEAATSTPQATSKPRKKRAAAAAKQRVKTSARNAPSRKISPAKSAKKTAPAKAKATTAKKTAPAKTEKQVAKKPSAKKAMLIANARARTGATKTKSNAKKMPAKKKNATASKAKMK